VKDLEIAFEHRVGLLAAMGEALGRAGVSVEGGGAFAVPGGGLGHFLVEDAAAAKAALEGTDGLRVVAVHDVLTVRLRQDEPGQLGRISRRMADAGVSIDVLYSDHDGNLILVVDDSVRGREVTEAWANSD
jgi:hypothetical protein